MIFLCKVQAVLVEMDFGGDGGVAHGTLDGCYLLALEQRQVFGTQQRDGHVLLGVLYVLIALFLGLVMLLALALLRLLSILNVTFILIRLSVRVG